MSTLGNACRTALLAVLVLGAGSAGAQELRRIQVDVMVSHVSDRAGSIDQRALELHRTLQRQIRYESLRVLQARHLALVMDEIASLQLPNGRHFRVRPMHLGDAGVLMAIQLEDGFNGDMRLRNHHLVVIGAQSYQDGKLVISVRPSY